MQHQPAAEAQRATLRWVASGSIMEAIGAMATIALAIVGLAGIFPLVMAAIATIVISAAILIEGGAFSAGSATVSSTSEAQAVEAGGGASTTFLGGIAGVILGILALLGVAGAELVAVALLVLGTTFMLSGVSSVTVGQMAPPTAGGPGFVQSTRAAGSGGQVMVGIAAVVLGILAVVGLSQVVLVLVGLLSIGGAALLGGSALGAKSLAVASR